MSDPFVGEIKMFGGNFAPAGWASCDGQLLPISENETLFNLIGTTYGGDGQSTFAVPNMTGRAPLHMGTGPGLSNYVIGETGGVESVTLNTNQIPIHTHPPLATAANPQLSPQGAIFAVATSSQAGVTPYVPNSTAVPLVSTSVIPVGGSAPHDNIQPTLCITFIISLFGIFPSPN